MDARSRHSPAPHRRGFMLIELLVVISIIALKPGQRLVAVKYFTARISGSSPTDPPALSAMRAAKQMRQALYLEAVAALPDVAIIEGHYLAKPMECKQCNCRWTKHEEKMTDVNIATELMVDVFDNAFDTALLISADSDLVRPVKTVVARFPAKRVVVAMPPGRHSVQLAGASSGFFQICEAKLKRSLLPATLRSKGGYLSTRPAGWR